MIKSIDLKLGKNHAVCAKEQATTTKYRRNLIERGFIAHRANYSRNDVTFKKRIVKPYNVDMSSGISYLLHLANVI